MARLPVRPKKGDDIYISGLDVCRLIGIDFDQFKLLVAGGRLGTWRMEGARTRYSRKDAERIRDAAFTPATR